MRWLNEPNQWSDENGTLRFTTEPVTDFWQQTHYGFVHANGHARLDAATGDFTASVRFFGGYRAQYDQAGLLLYANDTTWLKCGIEESSGHLNVSSVVTRDWSDWSVLKLPGRPLGPVTVRITRLGDTVMVDYSLDDARFDLIRLAYLPLGDRIEVGPMACSPTGPGFQAVFTDFHISDPLRRDDQ